MSQLIKVKCEICGFVLGTVDPDKLKKPLTGAMFDSISPGQFPAPFPPTVDWMWIRCPMCRKRPFQFDDRVVSDAGKVIHAEPPPSIKDKTNAKKQQRTTTGQAAEGG